MEHLGATPSCRFFQHTLGLRGGETALFDGLSASTRRNIRKAQRSELAVALETDEQAVREYYRLHVGTRAKHGAPPQPETFFLNVWRECVRPGNGFVALARKQGRAVAGAVFLRWRDRAVFKFGASDESEQELRPSNLVMWEAIRALAAQGCTGLDFGRTSLNAEGLRRFKEGWGAKESELRYWRYDLCGGRWAAGEDRAEGWQAAVFRRMPAFLQRQVGSVLYRHLD
jgi:lipid II:glycine glycyltransferase (peptidoglycan interpeptide bridge formation enzyme)